jgi:hypothetical protein
VPEEKREEVLAAVADSAAKVTAKAIKKAAAEVLKPKPEKPVSKPAPSKPPPIPPAPLDRTGYPIPVEILASWRKAEEVQELLSTVSKLRGIVDKVAEDRLVEWREVNVQSLSAALNQVYTDLKTVKPFAVCPYCQGKLHAKCTNCKGRGFISKHSWDVYVPREFKAIREKAQRNHSN